MLSALRAAKVKASRSALKRRSMPGRSTFTATARGRRRSRPRRDAPARSRRRRPPGRTMRKGRCSGLPSAAATMRLGLGLRERRHVVLQRFQIARQRHADHVGPRRQELAELDVGRAEPRSARRRAGLRARGWSAARSAARRVSAGARRQRQRRRIDQRRTRPRARTRSRRGRGGRDAANRGDHKPPAGMQRHHAAGHRLERDAARSRPRASSRRNRSGRGKRRIELDQIAVGLGVAGDGAAERRDRR